MTCDSCGTPYAAVAEQDELVLVGDQGSRVGEDRSRCPNCEGGEFTRLTL